MKLTKDLKHQKAHEIVTSTNLNITKMEKMI